MFDSPYSFNFVTKKSGDDGDRFLEEYKYAFKSRHNHRYIVNVERYEYEVYAIKFHLKAHTDSDRKYRLITGHYDAARIIATCIEIILQLYRENAEASFGFIGSPLPDETLNGTKRFRVYRRVMENFFSPVKFQHYAYPGRSAYLLLNRETLSDEMLQYIEATLREHPDLQIPE